MLAAARGEPTPAAVSAGPAPPERARVLLAEDDPLNALIARTMLERCGCDVHVVENGAAALEAMRTLAFDLAFLDLRMPKLDGRAAARQIRALPPPAGATPLIALTADAGEAERAEAIAAGMNDFLTKPIEPKRLQDVLARFTAAANEAKFAAS
jgi:CheY-like chemotaxis protein